MMVDIKKKERIEEEIDLLRWTIQLDVPESTSKEVKYTAAKMNCLWNIKKSQLAVTSHLLLKH